MLLTQKGNKMKILYGLAIAMFIVVSLSPSSFARDVVIYRSGADITNISSNKDTLSFDDFLSTAKKIKEAKATQEAQAKQQAQIEQEAAARQREQARQQKVKAEQLAKARQEAQVKRQAQIEQEATARQREQARQQKVKAEQLAKAKPTNLYSEIYNRDKKEIEKKVKQLEDKLKKMGPNGKNYEIIYPLVGGKIRPDTIKVR